MVFISKDILVVIKAVDEASGTIDNFRKNLDKLSANIRHFTILKGPEVGKEWFKPLKKGIENLGGSLKSIENATDAVTDATLRYGATGNPVFEALVDEANAAYKETKDIVGNLDFALQDFGSGFDKIRTITDAVTDSVSSFGASSDDAVRAMINEGLAGQKATRGIKPFALQIPILDKLKARWKLLGSGFREFRMEMLSVMFFGMALQRTMMGLLQPALETAGVFEIISTILEIFFLPFALALLDPLLALMDWFLGMPEPVQLFIGVLVALLAVIGTILLIVGNLSLAFDGLAMVFGGTGGLGGAITWLGGIITWLGATFGAIWTAMVAVAGSASGAIVLLLGPIIAAIILLYGAWQENSSGIMASLNNLWVIVQDIFGRITAIVGGAIAFIQAIFRGDADEALQILKNIFKDGVLLIIDIFWRLPFAILDVLKNVLWGIGSFTVKIATTCYELGSKILQSVADGIVAMYGVIKTVIGNIPVIGPLLLAGINVAEWLAGQVGAAVGAAAGGVAGAIGGAVSSFTGGNKVMVGGKDVTQDYLNKGYSFNATGGLVAPTKRQFGGLITKPTMTLLGEAGPEMVTPLGQSIGMGTISPTYYISANVSSDVDIRELAYKLNDLLVQDYRRLTYR